MKETRALLLAVAYVVCSAAFLPSSAAEDAQVGLTATIVDVVVYADRAQVTRDAPVKLHSGTAVYAFTKLPGWIDEGSIRLRLEPTAAGRIADVQVQTEYLAQADEEGIRKAQAAVQEIADQIAAIDDERKVLDALGAHVDSIRIFSLDKMPKDAAVRDIKVDTYREVIEFVGNAMSDLAGKKRTLEAQRRKLQPELDARRRKHDELNRRNRLEQRTVFVTIDAPQEAEAVLGLTCMVPGATWEPLHELRAEQDPKDVSLVSYAVLTQTTGEDWPATKLSFSTQRPAAVMEVPQLEALMVGGSRAVAQIIGSQDASFAAAAANFSGQVELWNSIANPDVAKARAMSSNLKRQYLVQDRVQSAFAKLQTRGTTAHFPAAGRYNVRTDGQQVRVRIGEVKLAAKQRIVAAPEASLNAARTVELVNSGEQPILPGKTSIYLGGAFLGQTEADFVAQGESFEMYLGVADKIKLSRTLDRKHSTLVHRGSRTQMDVAFVITVENLSESPASVQLTDRIPVSDTKDVKVRVLKIEPEVKPNTDGILCWTLEVPARQKQVVNISYSLDYPTELPKAVSDDDKAAAPMHRQIMKLEAAF